MKYRAVVFAGILVLVASQALAQDFARPSSQGIAPALASAPGSSTIRLEDRNSRYRLRPGDVFDIDFALSPEFNQTVSVQPDGFGSLKAVGSIPVQGQTLPELTESIKAAYARVLHDPLLVIVLKDFDKPYFIATGQVSKPGKYDLRSELTMTEALAIAGGVSEKAKISQVVLYRKTADGTFQGKVFNLKKLLAARNLSEDPHLLPGDLVYVPQNVFSRLRPFMPTASMGAYYSPMRY
jgi:polysaccharide biosynthesis/export protein